MKVSDILRVKGGTLYTGHPSSRWPKHCRPWPSATSARWW